MDFKGPFTASKDGGYTSLIGFKQPPSGYVHEIYLTDQLVPTVYVMYIRCILRGDED
jgi:hypothetical protein